VGFEIFSPCNEGSFRASGNQRIFVKMNSSLDSGVECSTGSCQARDEMLTPAEEMQYQRALWLNRLLKEQMAEQTRGMSIEEIELARGLIQERLAEACALDWRPSEVAHRSRVARTAGCSSWSTDVRTPKVSSVTASSAINRNRFQNQIREDNLASLKRIGALPPSGIGSYMRSGSHAPTVSASSCINRQRFHNQVRDENDAILRRLEGVKSHFAPKLAPSDRIPRLSPGSRLNEPLGKLRAERGSCTSRSSPTHRAASVIDRQAVF